MPCDAQEVILITGGHGFIGSHVARRLYELAKNESNTCIRIADIASSPATAGPLCHEFIQGNLCDLAVCQRAVQGASTVLHFAANMGGMGTIHTENDFIIFRENHAMTINLLEASTRAGVKMFFYASSACVYPEHLQSDPNNDVSLKECDVWSPTHPPKPQHLYGCEKLVSEVVLLQYQLRMDVRIARFHNVFGPGGSWRGGREKAPAAMIRKALALSLMPQPSSYEFEIWGDGNQRRSFLFIDDAVEGVLSLLKSRCNMPVNIGSNKAVSIKGLADMALNSVGIDPADVLFRLNVDKPTGVSSRNSNNEFAERTIQFQPTVSLEDGIRRTKAYIEEEMKSMQEPLVSFLGSEVINLDSERTKFAIILPITSRGGDTLESCLKNLRVFSRSLYDTTWRDIRVLGNARHDLAVYIAIDRDDAFLQTGVAQDILLQEGIANVVTVECDFPRGHVCSIWRECARRAWIDGCHYMVLMGDDVKLHDEGWMRQVEGEFKRISIENKVPFGIGCVAFTDITFPGMPTFPIVHRTHLDVFHGEVVPQSFINQDGDPYLFQLYRRWGSSIMFQSRISNGIGGDANARYTKHHTQDWTFQLLDQSVETVGGWLQTQECKSEQKLTIDVVIPCYRVLLNILDKILTLESSDSCSVMFIIIVDDPSSPTTELLNARYSSRPDVRIRVNSSNMGASYSRNRGLGESSAAWVHFLDDDVVPDDDLLYKDEEIIRSHMTAAGFVGNAHFPIADTVFTAAVHLAGVTYFWDIATKIDTDVPWGVTANLIARRNIPDGVKFDLAFPKTGGGEDIDFCRKKREFSIQSGGKGFVAAPDVIVEHPWWNNGSRSYWRFYNWSSGDGALVKLYPQHTYRDFSPNSSELLLACGVILGLGLLNFNLHTLTASVKCTTAVILANVLHDCYRHLYRDASRTCSIKTNVKGVYWALSVVESSFIRMFSEIGRTVGVIKRREWHCIGKRFDWFAGRLGGGPRDEERKNSVQRFLLVTFLVYLFL